MGRFIRKSQTAGVMGNATTTKKKKKKTQKTER